VATEGAAGATEVVGLPREVEGAEGGRARFLDRAPLERLFLGVTAAFGGFLRLGGVMFPLAGSEGFRAVLVRSSAKSSGLRVTKRFWQQVFGVSFNGAPLFWGLGLAASVRFQGVRGFGSGATTGGVGATTATGATEASSGLDTNNSG
jgi:hypothetical protein